MIDFFTGKKAVEGHKKIGNKPTNPAPKKMKVKSDQKKYQFWMDKDTR